MLVESLLYGLIERKLLSIDEAVVIVEGAADVKMEIAPDLGDTPEMLVQSPDLVPAIATSLRHDTHRR